MSDPIREPSEPAGPVGLACPDCGCRHLPTLYTRQLPAGLTRRVRECRHCGRRVRTVERVAG